MLAMTILVHFWVVYWTTEPHTPTLRFNLAHYNATQPPGPYYASQPATQGRAWWVLCAQTTHKPAHGHGHYHADRGPDFFFATEVTQGKLLSAHYAHTKRTPKSRCVF